MDLNNSIKGTDCHTGKTHMNYLVHVEKYLKSKDT
jgi:hypothetical protein